MKSDMSQLASSGHIVYKNAQTVHNYSNYFWFSQKGYQAIDVFVAQILAVGSAVPTGTVAQVLAISAVIANPAAFASSPAVASSAVPSAPKS